MFLLVSILLFIFALICYHYINQKKQWHTANIKMTSNELKNVSTDTCYYFDCIIKFENWDFDNILLDEKSYENVPIYISGTKVWLVQNLCILCSLK